VSLLQESARHNPGISAYDVLSANSDGCDVRKPLSYYRQKEVRFWAKDTRALRVVELLWPKEMFVATLGEHMTPTGMRCAISGCWRPDLNDGRFLPCLHC
jgi:hypothetical protein